jgi:hypothetical protein
VTYEMPVVQVSPSAGGRRIVAVVGVCAGVVLVAAIAGSLGSDSSRPGDRSGVEAAAGTATSATPVAARQQEAPAVVPREPALFPLLVARPLPTAIDCHDIDRAGCHRIVRAALRVLPDELPAVRGADVWRSLVCGDTFDCPPDYLRESNPMGSAVLRFDDAPGIAVNVVDWRYGSSVRLGLRAWLVRSTPVSD